MRMLLLVGGTVALIGGLASAEEKVDAKVLGAGRALYLRHCAACHGSDGKGGGPAAQALKSPVPDLTRLPQKDGKLDTDRIRTFIDGTQAATAHGTREMPVWGKVFERAGEKRGSGWAQTDIWTLVQYIASIQAAETGKK